jgi:hypothetical protein
VVQLRDTDAGSVRGRMLAEAWVDGK